MVLNTTQKFFKSPIEVLWTTSGKSRLLSRQKELGIVKPREYPVLQDIELTCIICGKKFVFSAVEQKQYKKWGLSHLNDVQNARCVIRWMNGACINLVFPLCHCEGAPFPSAT